MTFESNLHNKFLLWRGVKPQNVASILREGFKIVQAEAPATCFEFGAGLYFTDCSSKAANQSMTANSKTS